jgi:hypothetical protein
MPKYPKHVWGWDGKLNGGRINGNPKNLSCFFDGIKLIGGVALGFQDSSKSLNNGSKMGRSHRK